MALSTDSLYRPINSINDKLEGILDELTDLKSAATIFGGVIGQQLPGNIQSLITTVESMLDGGPSSVSAIIDFLDNVPMGEIRTKTAAEKRQANKDMSYGNTVDLTPHTDGGPKSATLQNESLNLEDFYRDEFKPHSTYRESDYSWEAIKNNPNIEATDLSGSGLFNEGFSNFNLDRYAEEAASEYADDIDNREEVEDTSLRESVEPDNWQFALREADPISFGPLNGNVAATGHLVN